jgi:hypothetical protein
MGLASTFLSFYVWGVEGMRVWTQGFTFAKQPPDCLSHTSVYFGDRVSLSIYPDSDLNLPSS